MSESKRYPRVNKELAQKKRQEFVKNKTKKPPYKIAYEPIMCEQVIELMKSGITKDEVILELGISPGTFYNWCREGGKHYRKDFAQAVKDGEIYRRAWFFRVGRNNMCNKDFQGAHWYKYGMCTNTIDAVVQDNTPRVTIDLTGIDGKGFNNGQKVQESQQEEKVD